MIHGNPINDVKGRARVIIRDTLVAKAEADGTPATLRAMYVYKAQQADVVLKGGESINRCIEREAEERGISPIEMATIISHMAGESVELELYRMKLNIAVDSASDETEIHTILAKAGMQYKELDPLQTTA